MCPACILGRSFSGVANASVSSAVAFFSPTVLDQQVFIVDFDDKGVVKDIGHKTLADAEHITPAPGATPSPGRELSFMEQLIGNIGRFGGSSTPGAASSTPNPMGH